MLKIKTLATALALGGILSVIVVGSVSANGGPHEGKFSVTTDACAGCHRIHTAQSDPLLINNNQYNLCMSCHDGTGSSINAKDGIYLGTTNGTQNAGLKGGGFEYALLNVSLDPSFNQTGTPQPVTSTHSIGANATLWGSGNATTGAYGGTLTDLECTNCHNPHGNGNYRMLRPQPTGYAWNITGWNGTAVTANLSRTITGLSVNTTPNSTNINGYTVSYQTNNGTFGLISRKDRTAMYSGFAANLSGNSTPVSNPLDDWCAQCHTRYIQANGYTNTLHTDNDPVYKYSHNTNSTGGCFMCHVAHGTSATMTGYANGVTWPDGTANQTWQTAPETSQTSRLLVANNRGACIQCHNGGGYTNN